MNFNRKAFFWIVMMISVVLLLSRVVSAVGVCTNDKFDYHPGESLLFSCACTSPIEENQPGFIVVLNQSGGILQNRSANSGLCRTSFLIETYTFVAGDNFTGNVTFSLLGNGSGSPVNWDGVGDITSDDYNVSGAHVLDCLINDVSGRPVDLGDLGSVKVHVTDAISGNKLVKVACQAEGYDINSTPLVFEPYGVGETVRFTGAGGEVGFQHVMSELFWSTSTTYLYEFHCHCLDNSSDEACYDETTGLMVGFKACTAKVPFMTTSVDKRNINKDLLPVIWVIIFTSLFFLVVGFITPRLGFKVAGIGVGIIELVLLAFIVFVNRGGNSIVGLLQMNFNILLILGFGVGFIGLIFFVVRMMNPADDLTGKDPELEKKWRNK